MSMHGENAGLRKIASLNETSVISSDSEKSQSDCRVAEAPRNDMVDAAKRRLIPPTVFSSLEGLLKIVVAEFFHHTGK